MTPLDAVLLTVAGLLVVDAALCLLAPLMRSNLAWSQAMRTNEQLRTRSCWLLAAAAVLLVLAA